MIAAHSEVVTYWRGIVGTLAQRGELRQGQSGQRVVPQAVAIVDPERVCFVLDMLRLAGVSRETWLNPALWAQIRATLQGRRCFVADSAGLAVVVAREPGEPQRKRLPARVQLDVEAVPQGDYTAYLGESKAGPVILDLAEGERAILVGGTSGSGKTGTIRALVLQMARKNDPAHLGLAIVDLKRLDFTALAGLPHLVDEVATTEEDAGALVAWAVQEMERRQVVMQTAQVSRWELLPDGDRFPLLLVVIDEAADFARSSVMDDLVELARKGRASGVSLILATQRPDSEVLSRQVKANVSTRIAFQTVDGVESRVILDRGGAEGLRRVGQCLTNAGGRWRKVQAAFVPDEDLGAWVDVAPAGPVLDEIEAALVRFSLDELDGAFTINALADAFQGEVSRRQLLKLGRAWERRGWLTSTDDVTAARRVTDDLAALVRGTGRGTVFEAVVPRGNRGTVVPEIEPGGGGELPAFLAQRSKITA